jgi:hypothetical protein
VTVKLAGFPSEALALGGDTVPLVHVMDILTSVFASSEKSFNTWKLATALFTSVQLPTVSVAWQVLPE